jgi:hypothetical protein
MRSGIYIIIALLFCTNIHAQSSGTQAASLILSSSIEVTITRGQQVNMNFSSLSDFQNGVSTQNAATVKIRSNLRYNLSVRSATTHFVSNTNTPMPVLGILSVRVFPQGQFIALSNTDATLLTNQNQGLNNVNVSYRATPGFNYDAGTYTANIIYTATQQ